MPEDALRALWRFARPLPRPGPRWSRVAAGRSAMRQYPSAAPVTTPSNSPSTQRMPGTRSSAATKCISDVPGLEKHVVTPLFNSECTRLSAPFMVLSPDLRPDATNPPDRAQACDAPREPRSTYGAKPGRQVIYHTIRNDRTM